jgi:uncharacterized protein
MNTDQRSGLPTGLRSCGTFDDRALARCPLRVTLYAPNMNSVVAEEIIERAGRALIDAASAPAKVILFGSRARGDADEGSDFDFLVIEQEVEDRLAEEVRLRRALRNFAVPVDVIVIDEALVKRRAKVKGTTVDRALREGRVVAES